MTLALTTPDAHPDLREPHWTWDTHPPSATAILHEGDTVLSLCRLFDRDLLSFECAFRVIGIGGVFTPPAHRRRGHAAALLGMLARQYWQRDAVAFVLHAKDGSFYRRLGYVPIQWGGLHAKPLTPGLHFLEPDHRVDARPWRLSPEGHF